MGSKTSNLYLDRTDVAVIAVAAGGMATYMVHFPKVLDDTVWQLVESLDEVFLAHLDRATTWTPPADVSPGMATIAVTMVVSLVTLVTYYGFIGRKNRAYRSKLRRRLRESYEEMKELESRLQELRREDMQELRPRADTHKPVRIFMEGAFDMMHFGHANAFRQALALGDELIVGINSSESIETCKGTAPIMNDLERGKSVSGCRFVKEVVRDVPYIMTPDYLDWVMKEYDIDYVVHGDDPCIVDGKDVYETVKRRGCFASIPRTEGVSTTDIVGRMLLVGNREHHMKSKMSSRVSTDNSKAAPQAESQEEEEDSAFISMAKHGGFSSKFMTTSNLITNFARGMRVAEPDAKIIYITGDWDMFNASHVEILRVAKSMGDYVIAGVFSDEHVNSHNGLSFPILNTNERLLSVMGCKYVDDVLINAPDLITHDMVASLKISHIVEVDGIEPMYTVDEGLEDLVKPIRLDQKVISVHEIIERIEKKREQFQKKFEKKRKAEDEYYNERYNRKDKK